MRKIKQIKRGFTLIELLVVISIIGLLSTLAVFSLNSARTKARVAKRISDMKMLSTAMEMYATDKGSYTDAATGCTNLELDTCHSIMYGGEALLDLTTLKDPSNSTGICGAALNRVCNYSFKNLGTEWYSCFYLEKPTGNQGSGLHAITVGGKILKLTGDTYCR